MRYGRTSVLALGTSVEVLDTGEGNVGDSVSDGCYSAGDGMVALRTVEICTTVYDK